jgi:hypothetical protein
VTAERFLAAAKLAEVVDRLAPERRRPLLAMATPGTVERGADVWRRLHEACGLEPVDVLNMLGIQVTDAARRASDAIIGKGKEGAAGLSERIDRGGRQ